MLILVKYLAHLHDVEIANSSMCDNNLLRRGYLSSSFLVWCSGCGFMMSESYGSPSHDGRDLHKLMKILVPQQTRSVLLVRLLFFR